MHPTRLLLPLFAAAVPTFAQGTAPAPKQPLPPPFGPTKAAPESLPKPIAPAPIQDHGAAVGRDVMTPMSPAIALPATVRHDVAQDGTRWARGASWKASFDDQTFTFIPFLGSDAARNWPLALTLQQVAVGEQHLALTAAPTTRNGDVLHAERGACTERFDLRSEAVEQSWIFHQLPTRGELRLRLHVATDLRGEDLGADLWFQGPDGGIRYDRAVAIDARGLRCPLQLDLHDKTIELTVPAAFVEQAELPLIVDPFTTTTPIAFTGSFAGNPDLAFDYTTQEFLLVWQHAYSATDHDVWAQRLDLGQTPIGAPFTIDFTTTAWTKPHVANNGLTDRFLVVAECSAALTSPRWIGGRMFDVAQGVGTAFDVERPGVTSTLAGDALSPDVGGDPLELGPTYFTVVWEHEYSTTDHDIRMRQVTTDGSLRGNAPTGIDTSTGFESVPRIGKSNGYSSGNNQAGQHWTVVWQRTYSATDEDIRGTCLTWDGQFVQGISSYVISSASADERAPVVSSPTDEDAGVRHHLIAYSRAVAGQDTDIELSVWDNSLQRRVDRNLQTLEGAGAWQPWPQGLPAVDCDGVRFSVAYSELFGGTGGDFDVRVSTVAFLPGSGTLAVHEGRVALAVSSRFESDPAIASTWSGGGGSVYHGILWQDFTPPTMYGVHATIYRAHASQPLPTMRATGCGGLGIAMSDLPALGRSVSFDQTDSGPLTGFLFGFRTAQPIGACPGCTLGVQGSTFANPFSVAVPPTATLVGVQLACQAWSFVAGPCLGSIALSDTIDLTIL